MEEACWWLEMAKQPEAAEAAAWAAALRQVL
jgi:hypothetical protein